jgi:hypothetical protein
VNEGWLPEKLKITEDDFWQHLCNMWFGAVIKQLSITRAGV